jgi:hypothetical protein
MPEDTAPQRSRTRLCRSSTGERKSKQAACGSWKAIPSGLAPGLSTGQRAWEPRSSTGSHRASHERVCGIFSDLILRSALLRASRRMAARPLSPSFETLASQAPQDEVSAQDRWCVTARRANHSGFRISRLALFAKIFPFTSDANHLHVPDVRSRKRGVGHRHERWDRMRWTHAARKTSALTLRTEKSCGPDASTPASSS